MLKAICEMKHTAVFLDGLIDVIGDFNNNIECQKIIYQCMAVASHYGISMWCLLHLNPGSDKMVGHVGSFLERKATDVLKTKKDKDAGFVRFTVTQNKARARDLDDWSFRIEDDEQHYGHPVIEAVDITPKEDNDNDEDFDQSVIDTITNLYHQYQAIAMSYNELNAYLNIYGVKSKKKQDKVRKRALAMGLLRKDELNGKYYLSNLETKPKENDDDPF